MAVVNLLLRAPGKLTESAPALCAGPGEYPESELSHLRWLDLNAAESNPLLATLGTRAIGRKYMM
jgi:hypothetical protein